MGKTCPFCLQTKPNGKRVCVILLWFPSGKPQHKISKHHHYEERIITYGEDNPKLNDKIDNNIGYGDYR